MQIWCRTTCSCLLGCYVEVQPLCKGSDFIFTTNKKCIVFAIMRFVIFKNINVKVNQKIIGLKTRLVCVVKKPCLEGKEALFLMQVLYFWFSGCYGYGLMAVTWKVKGACL